MRNLYLIGFMGCGKSAAAACIERISGMPAVEMDRGIEADCGMTVPEIFETEGESFFREKETLFLRRTAERNGAAVSCGGGVPLRQENVDIMKASGTVVLLTASPETVLERIGRDDSRPLLKGRMSVQNIEELMKKRKAAYETAADIVVDTDGKTPVQVAEEILRSVS